MKENKSKEQVKRYVDQINKSVNTYCLNKNIKKGKMSFNTISYNTI